MWRCSHRRPPGAVRPYAPATPTESARRRWRRDPSASTTRPTARAPLPVVIDPALGPLVAPWHAHRERFLAAGARPRRRRLGPRDPLRRLVGARGRRAPRDRRRLLAGRDGGRPRRRRRRRPTSPGFDPSSSPDQFVKATTADDVGRPSCSSGTPPRSTRCTRSSPRSTTTRGTAGASRRSGTSRRALILAHGYWDSWLHEYDVFVPLGDPPAPDADDLLAATWFSLVMAGSAGWSGRRSRRGRARARRRRSTSCLAFSDLPDAPLHLSVGTLADGVAVTRCAPDHTPVAAGRAVDLVEGLTGRQDPVRRDGGAPGRRRRAGAARVRSSSDRRRPGRVRRRPFRGR